MKKHIILILTLFLCGFTQSHAQSSEHKGLIWLASHGLDYEVKAGINIGGTSPLPLPKEIRSLDNYSPGLAITLEGNATKWIDIKQKWGVSLGIKLDSKEMETKASVKTMAWKYSVKPEEK